MSPSFLRADSQRGALYLIYYLWCYRDKYPIEVISQKMPLGNICTEKQNTRNSATFNIFIYGLQRYFSFCGILILRTLLKTTLSNGGLLLKSDVFYYYLLIFYNFIESLFGTLAYVFLFWSSALSEKYFFLYRSVTSKNNYADWGLSQKINILHSLQVLSVVY